MYLYTLSMEITFESNKQLTEKQIADMIHNQVQDFIDSFAHNNNLRESESHDSYWYLTKED